jgi:hypothetical protein
MSNVTGWRTVLAWGAAVALVVAFGRFLASNIIQRSDYPLVHWSPVGAGRARGVVLRMEHTATQVKRMPGQGSSRTACALDRVDTGCASTVLR